MDPVQVARRVLELAGLPQPPALQRAKEGIANHVYFAGDVVVRLGTGSDAVHYGRSAAVMRAASAIAAVPDVLFCDVSMSVLPVRVMVVARAPGVPVRQRWTAMDRSERLAVMHQVAQQLDRLHTLRPCDVPDAGFGEPWFATSLDEMRGWLDTLPGAVDFPAERFDALNRVAEAAAAALSNAPPTVVVHNDVHWGNVLVQGGQLTAVLDFDDVQSGPAEIDAWGLWDAAGLDDDPWVEPRELARLPGFDLSDPGALLRAEFAAAHAILEHLSGRLSWCSAAESLADAHETWQWVFVQRQPARQLQALNGA